MSPVDNWILVCNLKYIYNLPISTNTGPTITEASVDQDKYKSLRKVLDLDLQWDIIETI